MPSHKDDSPASSTLLGRICRSLQTRASRSKQHALNVRDAKRARRSSPVSHTDALEPRQLLATDFYLSFDFQHRTDATASGYIADTGVKYSRQAAAKFGWDTNNAAHTRNRHSDDILRRDTISFLGLGDSAKKWELGLQPGLYEVGVVAGDAKYADGHYVIKAEGSTVVNHVPTAKQKFATGYAQVWVSDGRLTISSGGGAVGNKLASVTVRKLEKSTAESAGKPSTPPSTPTTPSKPTTPTNPTTPGGNTSAGIINHSAVAGIVNNEMPAAKAIPIMKALGMKSVRIWYSINSWNQGINLSEIHEAQQYKAAGLSVTVAFVSTKVGDPAAVKAQFQKIASRADYRAAVDYWEIGNEMNLGSFWNSSLKSYVTNYLKPAYEALHPLGEKVIGGGVSWDVNAARQLVSYGYNNYCDYAGFHPYGESGAIVAERTRNAKAAFGNKPLIVTEWNVQFVHDPAKWAREITIAARTLAQTTALSYYYALRVDGSHVGKGGAVYNNGTKNSLFYNALRSWTN